MGQENFIRTPTFHSIGSEESNRRLNRRKYLRRIGTSSKHESQKNCLKTLELSYRQRLNPINFCSEATFDFNLILG